MKKLLDYQWPNCFLNKSKFNNKVSGKNNRILINKIEKFFYNKFGVPAKIFPSGRSCIGSIFEYEKINRSDEVFVSKWVSNCIFNAVGFFSNPSINFEKQKVIMVNNIWGLIQNTKLFKKNKILIDDSCDSIILNKKNLFPSNSKYEIFSLPKLIGSVAGGIVISKDKKFLVFCNERQKRNKKFGMLQAKMKFDEVNNYKNLFDYRYKEAVNTYTEYNSLIDIENKLSNYDINKKIILERLKNLKKIVSFDTEKNRIGPVALIDIKKIKNTKSLEKVFMFRHKVINYNTNYSKKYLLFPIHFMVKKDIFNFYLKILRKHLK